jgi:dienelactone hydrolase
MLHSSTFSSFLAVALVLFAAQPGKSAEPGHEVQTLQTPSGVRYGVRGAKPNSPAPTLFVLASTLESSLQSKEFNDIGNRLAEKGFLCVALDAPCHGKDVKAGEPDGLRGWRARLEKGVDLVPGFAAQCSAVLDHLVRERYTDPARVAVCGTSRGGFLALHWAAAEPRVQCAVAFAPVTNLLALREFNGMDRHAATQALNLERHADKLAGRPVWVCIGNHDERVSTDDVIRFTRRVVAASVAAQKKPLVEIHVMPSPGHTIHPTAHAEAAAWALARIKV